MAVRGLITERRRIPSRLAGRRRNPVKIRPGRHGFRRAGAPSGRPGGAGDAAAAARRGVPPSGCAACARCSAPGSGRVGRGRRRRPRHRRRRVLLDARPVRLGQDHRAADDRRLRAARPPGTVQLGGRDVTRLRAVRARRQHRLPGLRAVPAHDVLGRTSTTACGSGRCRKAERREPGPSRRSRRCGSRASATGARPSSPAASGSGSRSPGRWSTGPRCCCSTSRSARSTSSCARRCRSSSRRSSARSASPSCSSPTTRRRR